MIHLLLDFNHFLIPPVNLFGEIDFYFQQQLHLRIFEKVDTLQITSFLVLEEAPPILLIAIGLDNGCIYCIQGDIARERIKRFMLQVDSQGDKSQLSITGLAFRIDGATLQLFVVTPTSVSLFNLQTQPAIRHNLDQIGCNVKSVGMSDRSVCQFVVCFSKFFSF